MRFLSRAIAVSAVLLFLANPSPVFAQYTSTVAGSTATMVGGTNGDLLAITQSGGVFQHNRPGGEGFNGPSDFDTTVAGDQTVSSTTGIININAGAGNDTIVFGDGVDVRGAIDGGIDTDTIDYSPYTTAIRANLGLSTTGSSATLGGNQEVPATTHAGSGTATVANYNPVTRTFDISVSVSGLPPGDVIGFHIHQERVNVNGPIIVNFPSGGDPALVPSGTGFTFTATGLILPPASEAAFLGGGTYVNIHTATFPGGAIRGQLFSAANVNLSTGAATGTTSVANVENVTGGSGGDSLVGNSGANTINGGGGVDWMLGGPGGDTFGGDAGNDVMIWSNGDGTDVMEGGGDSGDTVQVNGSTTANDVFIIGANGARIDFDRTSPGPFSLDIGTTETLIVNGIGGDDSITVNNLASLSILHANGFDGNDTIAYSLGAVSSVAFFPNGGLGSDTLNISAPTGIRANLGLTTSGLTATLGGDQFLPASGHAGTGTATVTNYNVNTRTFDISVTVSDLPPGDVTSFRMIQSLPRPPGPTSLFDFTAGPLTPSGTGFTFTATGLTLPPTSEAAFLGGGTFLHIATTTSAIGGTLFSSGNVSLDANVAVTGATGVAGFESVSSGGGDDSLVGNFSANALNGSLGDDWILGGPGNDTLGGGDGEDILIWSNGDGSDVMEGNTDGLSGRVDTVQVNGSTTAGDTFVVSANGTRVNVSRTNLGLFSLDIGTVERLIVNGVGGDDTFTVNSLTGVDRLSEVNQFGLAGNDTFNNTAYTAFPAGVPLAAGGLGNDTFNYDAQSRTVTGDLTPPDGFIQSTLGTVQFFNTETVTITNPAPSILISDVTVSEAASPAVFNVTLSAPSPLTVTVQFGTVAGSAADQGVDFSSTFGTLTFVPGDTSEPISVPITADTLTEPAEIFYVNLSTAANAAIADAQGQGTITDNAPPTISAIPNQIIATNSSTGPLPFVVGDAETAAASLGVSATSSNPGLVGPGGFGFGGGGANRTINVTPIPDASGTAIITVTVNDGILTASTNFTLTVDAPAPPPPPPPPPPGNSPPTLAGLGNQTIDENGTVTLTLTVGDDSTAPGNLAVSATSSNGALVPASGLVLGGSGATRTLTITPLLDTSGQTTITVSVSDGALATTQNATVTVVAVTPATPLLPPTGLIATVVGNDVLLSWTAPATGGRPSFYVIEGGTAPGTSTLPVVQTPTPATSATLPLAPGSYFVRVRSGNRAGTSAVSNEVAVVITTAPNVPGAPVGLQVTVVATRVTLSWQRPVTGGVADAWIIELDTTPGPAARGVEEPALSDRAINGVEGAGDVRTFVLPASVLSVSGDLARGEYVVRVRGLNAAGPGPASNAPRFGVDLPGGGGCDVPDAPVLLPPTINGRIVTLGWRPPRVGAPVSYRLLVGSAPGGANLAIVNVGPVNAFVFEAPPGTYYATIVATNTCGPGVASNSVPVVVSGLVGPPPPSNLRAQVVGNTVTLAWDAAPGAVSYVIEAGSAPGASNAAVFPLVATTLTVPGVPTGVYFVRVRAVGAGGASAPSTEIVIVVP